MEIVNMVYKLIKQCLLFLMLLAVAAALIGCENKQYSDSEAKALKDRALAVVEAYLSGADPGAKITSIEEMTVRPNITNHNNYLTDFVRGAWTSGGQTFTFAVNTRTEELYTTFEFEAFQQTFSAYVAEKLGIPAENAAISLRTALPLTLSAEHPEYRDYPFENMLPAGIPDMEAFVREAAEREDMNIYLDMAFLGEAMDFPFLGDVLKISAENNPFESIHPGADSVFSIYRLAGDVFPAIHPADLDLRWAPVFAAQILRLEKGKTSLATYAFEESEAPFILHFPERIVLYGEDGAKSWGSKVTSEGGADGDFFLEQSEPQRLIVHAAPAEETGDFQSHVLLRDLSAADNVSQVLMKERAPQDWREWYKNYNRWEPACGLYVLSAYGSPDYVQNGDVLIYGQSGQTLLKEQEKSTD
ncbi:MAG: hypothetical protein J6P72_04910 [Firmicutes bacterium]|nr:hypothetical protein [Bacillota bacterium]